MKCRPLPPTLSIRTMGTSRSSKAYRSWLPVSKATSARLMAEAARTIICTGCERPRSPRNTSTDSAVKADSVAEFVRRARARAA